MTAPFIRYAAIAALLVPTAGYAGGPTAAPTCEQDPSQPECNVVVVDEGAGGSLPFGAGGLGGLGAVGVAGAVIGGALIVAAVGDDDDDDSDTSTSTSTD